MAYKIFFSRIEKLLAPFLLLAALTELHAEENTLRFGLSLEGNLSAFDTLALGRSFSIEFQWFKYIVNGIIIAGSDDFIGKTIIEAEVFGRWYFLSFGSAKHALFVQGDLGISLLLENSNSEPRILAGITGGCRFYSYWRDYFIEPYLKAGYPFITGFGVRVGCRL
ncbi:MAG: hypothetical protein LBG73_02290 [Spirochaetaceae bacterium]|jgi:hypothetical protein|nr:hypothetical protein [Spirochaetaceae bacterium]